MTTDLTTEPQTLRTASSQGLALCKACHYLQPCPPGGSVPCARCSATVSIRTPYSLARCWFFLILAMLLLIPANVLPMMDILMFNRGDPSTIIGGVVLLVHHGIYGIAAVVFIASFVVPLGKIGCIIALLVSVQRGSAMSCEDRTRAYRVVEFLGRWSMLDVFVVAILVGLVRLGQVASIEPGMGAMAFGASVILTMLASMSFDPRLIWDSSSSVSPVSAISPPVTPPSPMGIQSSSGNAASTMATNPMTTNPMTTSPSFTSNTSGTTHD